MISLKRKPRSTSNENVPSEGGAPEGSAPVETDYTKGVPKGAKTAAEMYEVLGSFKRFNQKYNMTRQRFWDPDAAAQDKRSQNSLKKLLEEEKPGYTYVDYAYQVGSNANIASTGFSINMPNVKGNSWTPMRPAQPKDPWVATPKTASDVLRKVAKLYGADIVGFARLDRRWVYSHYWDEETSTDHPIMFTDEPGYEQYDKPQRLEDRTLVIPKEMQYAVVLIFEMDEGGIAAAPTLLQQASTGMTYSKISYTTVQLAEFIRGLGYHAIPSSNCTALNIPLGIEAGLGQLGRNAKLITQKYGPRCRIAKVITNLPMEVGQPKDFGVTEFCNACKKCARNCAIQAIPFGGRSYQQSNNTNHNMGPLQWMLNHKLCREYQSRVGTNCGMCLRTCPYNKGHHWIHDVTRFFIRNFRWMDPLIAKGDDLLGFGKYKPSTAYWGLEDSDRWRNDKSFHFEVDDAYEGSDPG
ncbi:MAG: reductive dehalogenase [Planctomyces sp.]|jgi:reductive dehalogenase|nr:reductive dehalogenase [Planctomyces sp.]